MFLRKSLSYILEAGGLPEIAATLDNTINNVLFVCRAFLQVTCRPSLFILAAVFIDVIFIFYFPNSDVWRTKGTVMKATL